MVYNKKITVWSVLKIIILVLVSITMIYPFLYMTAVTFSSNFYVLGGQITIFPKGFNIEAYKNIFQNKQIFIGYKNTIIYVLVGTAIALFITTLGAYALSKSKKLIFHSFFTVFFLIPLLFNGGMIPTYLAISSYGMIDSIWAVVLPGSVSIFNLIIMRSFFVAGDIKPIEESGELDGMNDIQILLYLVLPTSQAILATIGLFYAVGLWNSFMGPFLYLNTASKFTLQMIIRQIVLQGVYEMDEVFDESQAYIIADTVKYTAIIVSIAPIIAIYPFIQKFFVKGVMIGSVKG
jgi:putative aldouronate transport system permease protein